ncbi:hypothetical protein Pint_17786 [Pistacia integerrima]|uniref:Uncharacterized protein n=1 Tax=Pistacia integerrima TaxID=434235 RepID=A0ACC0YXD0_9ROSI|nr:hypothetical protein Pint_17786 [Pistacia integerrima]
MGLILFLKRIPRMITQRPYLRVNFFMRMLLIAGLQTNVLLAALCFLPCH